MIYTGAISLGEFFTLLFYSFLIFNPLYELPTLAKHLQEAKASAQTLQDIFDLQIEQHTDTGQAIEHITSIRYDSVTFAYDQQPAIQDISFTIAPGETIAFVGPS
jgi:ATP-binding cassette subfamily B protein